MARQKKESAHINYKIRKDVKERLLIYADEKGQTATMAIERILDKYLTEYFKDKE